jgi:hypothetical protein
MAKPSQTMSSAVCPVRAHRTGTVVRNGTRVVGGVTFQRFLCRPVTGAAHTLQAPLNDGVPEFLAPSAPERCPRHPHARTVRAGRRAGANGVVRQLYRCFPTNGDAPHRFRPPLSRLAVDHGETCPECRALRGRDRGDTNAARGHRYTARVVAAALGALGGGDSYGAVGQWAREQARAGHDLEAHTAYLRSREETKRRRAAWRLAADWTETFTPVLWEPWAARARAEVLEALAGRSKDRAVVTLMIDDIPIFTKGQEGGRRGKQRFAVLAATETFADPSTGQRRNRLRLLRAYPNHDADAYRLLLAELGYVPDVILADGGSGIGGAVKWLRRASPGRSFVLMLSAYHLRSQLRRQFSELTKPYGFVPGDLLDRLQNWSFCASGTAWRSWWSDYEARLVAQGIPPSSWPQRWIKQVKPTVDAQMDLLDENQLLPRSTGALEATLFGLVEPSLSRRAAGFGNLARTNRLLDLMVLRANGEFSSQSRVIEQLNADVRLHDGYAPPVRALADRRMERSLLDETSLERLTKAAGV